MAMQAVKYRGNLASANTNRLLSSNVWRNFPIPAIRDGERNGLYFFDDFDRFPLIGTQTTEIAHGPYKVFASSGGSVLPISAVNSVEMPGTFLQFGVDTDNESATLAQSYPSFLMNATPTYGGLLCFEARVAVSSILTNTIGFFFGLAEVEQWTLATGVPFNGASATITNAASAIGFLKGEDDLGVVNTVYSDRATSWTNIQATAGTISAANTFVKLGMRFDPKGDEPSKMIRFFIDNVECTTAFSGTSLAALTNLDANSLGLMFSLIADSSGTSAKAYLDWWAVGQVFEN